MKSTVTQEGPTKVRITVEATSEELAPAVERAVKRLGSEVKIPGFRKGHVPRQVIEARLGSDEIKDAAIREAVPELFRQAMTGSDVQPITLPEIEVTSYDEKEGFTFDAVVEVKPEITLPDFSTISVERPPSEVTDDELSEQTERLRERFATLETVARPGRRGDFALIDLNGYQHDNRIDEASAIDLLYEIGSGRFVPELDQELDGSRQGDILKFNATLPDTYPGEFGGKEISFQVLVKEIRQKNLPALDDEFAKTASEFDTLAELRSDIRTKLEEMAEGQAENRLRESVLEAFAEKGVEVDLPDGMVEIEIDGLLSSLAQLLAAQGVGLDRYMQANDLDGPSLRNQFREQAERNLTMRLGLDAVAKNEALQVTEEDRSKEIERLATRAGRTPDDVRESIEDGEAWKSVDGDILRSKALDLLVERADITVTDEPGPPDKESS
jgi:trigger factor